MTARRVLRVALVALVAFGVQVVHGAPVRRTRTLRAVSCCGTLCHHARSAAAADRCCGVRQGDIDAAATAPTRADVTPLAVPVLAFAGTADLAASAVTVLVPTAVRPPGRAAPLFLATHALLI